MKRAAWGTLVCLCGVLTFAVEASVLGKEAGTAAGPPTLEPVQPVLDLAESTSASKDKHDTTATSTAATLSTVATGGSGSTRAGDAMPRQPILPYNGTFDTSIPIKVPPFHGIEPKLSFHYNSAGSIRDFARPGGELGIGWNIDGLSVIEAAALVGAYRNSMAATATCGTAGKCD